MRDGKIVLIFVVFMMMAGNAYKCCDAEAAEHGGVNREKETCLPTPEHTATPGECSCAISAGCTYYGIENGHSFYLNFTVADCPSGGWWYSSPPELIIQQTGANQFLVTANAQKEMQMVSAAFTYGTPECSDTETITVGIDVSEWTPGDETATPYPTWSPEPTATESTPTPPPTDTPEGGGPGTTTPTCPTVAANQWNLNVPHFQQEMNKWCWAACCQMILEFFNQSRSQCEIASAAYLFVNTPTPEPSQTPFQGNCCPDAPICNHGKTFTVIQSILGHFGVNSVRLYSFPYSMPFYPGQGDCMYDQLRLLGKPIMANVCIGGISHAYVIEGYEIVPDLCEDPLLYINDPLLNYGAISQLYSTHDEISNG